MYMQRSCNGIAVGAINDFAALERIEKAGIIKGKISGNEKCYCINAEVWQTIKKELDNFFSQFEKNKEECCSD